MPIPETFQCNLVVFKQMTQDSFTFQICFHYIQVFEKCFQMTFVKMEETICAEAARFNH